MDLSINKIYLIWYSASHKIVSPSLKNLILAEQSCFLIIFQNNTTSMFVHNEYANQVYTMPVSIHENICTTWIYRSPVKFIEKGSCSIQ